MEEHPNSSTTILIVDDEVDILDILSDAMTMSGFNVLTAKCGSDAFELLKSHKVNLVLTDINMPKFSGLQLMTKCRKQHFQVPFVFLTGNSSTEIIIEAKRLGAMDFVMKPFEYPALEKVLKRVLTIADKKQHIEDLLLALGTDVAPLTMTEITNLRRQIDILKTMREKL